MELYHDGLGVGQQAFQTLWGEKAHWFLSKYHAPCNYANSIVEGELKKLKRLSELCPCSIMRAAPTKEERFFSGTNHFCVVGISQKGVLGKLSSVCSTNDLLLRRNSSNPHGDFVGSFKSNPTPHLPTAWKGLATTTTKNLIWLFRSDLYKVRFYTLFRHLFSCGALQ